MPLVTIEKLVTQMCNLQKHGGPDDAGLYSCPESNLVLGHRRLALIDLSPSGHQPMLYHDRYVISFNGEIYNHEVVRSQLESLGHKFNSHSDTEVIIYAYKQWGIDCIEKLEGMFAFSLFDLNKNELFLVRDRIGVKPLYLACKIIF